ncbi:MAG: ribosomal L7Ae/L30e/S12e/Gadd45 family protein [Candidatus Aenigmarchaeota archaeon]|nr:ribosomal L7Ae/L30e/S12e/Gadd45 family protein [Candidatus Aenigmarchaeota archaeon]
MSTKEEIKKALEDEKAIMGTRQVTKNAKASSLSKIIYADNAPELTTERMKFYSKLSGVEVVIFKGNSVELGRLCGKPFGITVMGIKK